MTAPTRCAGTLWLLLLASCLGGCELLASSGADGGGIPPSLDGSAPPPTSALELPPGTTAESQGALRRFSDGSLRYAGYATQRDIDLSVVLTYVFLIESADGGATWSTPEQVVTYSRGMFDIDSLLEEPVVLLETDGQPAVVCRGELYRRGADGAWAPGEAVPFPDILSAPVTDTVGWASDGHALHALYWVGGHSGPGRLVYTRWREGRWTHARIGFGDGEALITGPRQAAVTPDGAGGAHVVFRVQSANEVGGRDAPSYHDTFAYVHADGEGGAEPGPAFDTREAYFRATGRAPSSPQVYPTLSMQEGVLTAIVPLDDGVGRWVVAVTTLEGDRWTHPRFVWSSPKESEVLSVRAWDGGAFLWQHPAFGADGPASGFAMRWDGGSQPLVERDAAATWVTGTGAIAEAVVADDALVVSMQASWNDDASSTLTFRARPLEGARPSAPGFLAEATSDASTRVAFELSWTGGADALASELGVSSDAVRIGEDGAWARVDASMTTVVIGGVAREVAGWVGPRTLASSFLALGRTEAVVPFPDGRVALLERDRVQVLEQDWTTLEDLPPPPEGYVVAPLGGAVDDAGRLWVRDEGGVRVWDGLGWRTWDRVAIGASRGRPVALVLEADGRHWLSMADLGPGGAGQLFRLEADAWAPVTGPGVPDGPGVIARGADGALLALPFVMLASTSDQLARFADGAWSSRTLVADPRPVQTPYELVAGADGTLYVAGAEYRDGGTFPQAALAAPGGLLSRIEDRIPGWGIAHVTLTPDGRLLVWGGDDLNRGVAVHADGVTTTLAEEAGTTSLAFDAAGHLVLAGAGRTPGDTWVRVRD